jgi:hypothetical protein
MSTGAFAAEARVTLPQASRIGSAEAGSPPFVRG